MPTKESAVEWVRPLLATKAMLLSEVRTLSSLKTFNGESFPAITAFTMETPLYRQLNRFSREVGKDAGAQLFQVAPLRCLHNPLCSMNSMTSRSSVILAIAWHSWLCV